MPEHWQIQEKDELKDERERERKEGRVKREAA